ncbi:MAG: MerR family transcriptional regulator [Candidatus Marinimicrobia bacterium]|nr:MerR family transcriptional regulator [Candidatus Neomarinimicrobiota bacterium]
MLKDIKKLYYSIGEVSEILDVKKYVLRYWEKEFTNLSPSKNSSGNRVYKEKDIKLLNLIKYLLYEKKYTIEGANELVRNLDKSEIDQFYKTGELKGQENGDDAEVKQLREVARNIKSGLQDILQILDEDEEVQ